MVKAGRQKIQWATTALLVAAALASLLIWWLHSQPERLKNQLQSSRQVLLDTATTLLQLPAPSAVEPGQSGGTASYQAEQLQQAADKLSKKNFNPPSAALLAGLTHASSDVGKLYDSGRSALADARRLAAHEAAVMAALQKTLAYNGAIDFAKFKAGSSDTQTRLQKARTGLADTIIQLQGLSLNSDPTQPKLIDQLKDLSAARDRLEQNGDVSAWAQAVTAAQQSILTNRQDYWASQISSINDQLQTVNNRLAHLQADLH